MPPRWTFSRHHPGDRARNWQVEKFFRAGVIADPTTALVREGIQNSAGAATSRLDALTLSSTFSAQDSLFAHLGKHEIFTPTKTYPPMTVSELAAAPIGVAPQEAVS